MKKQWIVYVLLIPICFGFYIQNKNNYELHKEIQSKVINHPEKLPTSNAAILSSFGNRKLLADFYWLQTVQYIGSNVISGEYKRYLFAIMNLITDIDPNFEDPYIIGQLLLPSNNDRYENFSSDEVDTNVKEGEKLGLKGIKQFCDAQKVEAIFNEDNLQKIIEDETYKNPCDGYKIPYYLAYIYHFYLNDSLSAAKYYKLVAAQEDAPIGAKVLAAIMEGKGGQREKSTHMFLSLAQSLSDSQSDACNLISAKLQETYNYITVQNQEITGELVANIEAIMNEIIPEFSDDNEREILDDTKCLNYLAKAAREINLLYLEQADKKYVSENPDKDSAHTPEKLFELGYINFIPTDFQQYSNRNQGIIYRYDPVSKGFDYEMGVRQEKK